jgi:acyl carrier protein
VHQGDLFVSGRLKDLIIIGGRNLFPQDIEETVNQVMGSSAGKSAAFSVDAGRGEALAILVELPRQTEASTHSDLVRAIRRTVIEVHEVDPRHVLLVRLASIPVTSSGKVQRSRCRERFESGEIKFLHRYDRHVGGSQSPIPIPDLPSNPQPEDRSSTQSAIESWMVEWLISRGGVSPGDVDLERPFAEYGLDSMTAVEMSGEIEDWSGIELTPMVAWNHPTVARLSGYITDQLLGEHRNSPVDAGIDPLENLLSEIEQMSDEETHHALAAKRQK